LQKNRIGKDNQMSKKAKVRTDKLKGITIMDVRGYVNRDTAPALRDAYEEIQAGEEKKLLLRLDEETYFNSEAIKTLIDILADARNKGIIVGITGLSDHFEKIFRMVGVTALATVYNTVKGALNALEELD
jgi:anti-anti-sigma factor